MSRRGGERVVNFGDPLMRAQLETTELGRRALAAYFASMNGQKSPQTRRALRRSAQRHARRALTYDEVRGGP